MKVQTRTPKTRRGFTLIELVVVLLVLAGLAGILVPVVQNMVVKTHGSSGASNIAEVAKAIQLYEAQTMGSHPNGYDSLLSDSSTLAVESVHLQVAEPDAGVADALNSVGITTTYLQQATEDTNNKTFDPYGDPLAENEINGTSGGVASLTTTGVAALGFPAGGTYVAFGVGALNTAIGKTMLDAPVHFPENGQDNPANSYSRFLAIYEIPADGPARLATVAALHDGELSSLGTHLNEYYETTTQL